MNVKILVDDEELCEFKLTNSVFLRMMYKFLTEFEENEDFINRMSKK